MSIRKPMAGHRFYKIRDCRETISKPFVLFVNKVSVNINEGIGLDHRVNIQRIHGSLIIV